MSSTLEPGLSEHLINQVGKSNIVPVLGTGLKMLAITTFCILEVLFRSSIPY